MKFRLTKQPNTEKTDTNDRSLPAQAGFTIVEMIVVISIFALMASLMLFRYRDYESNINLESTSQDIALAIQKAENSAIGGTYPTLAVAQVGPSVGWRPSYGVYFDTANPKQFAFFFDKESYQPENGNYLPLGSNGRGFITEPTPFSTCGGTTAECLNLFTITGDISVMKVCSGTMLACTNQPSNSYNSLAITFTRPFPDATGFSNVVGPGTAGSAPISEDMRIRIKNDANNSMRDIVVTPLGGIHIESVLP